ncbi:hypothetical protein V8E54_015097 [Elaphomyces granulatus]
MNRGALIVLSIALDMSLVSFTVVAGLATQGLHAQIYSQWVQHGIIFAVKPDKISALKCYPLFSLHAWVTIQGIFIIPYCASFQIRTPSPDTQRPKSLWTPNPSRKNLKRRTPRPDTDTKKTQGLETVGSQDSQPIVESSKAQFPAPPGASDDFRSSKTPKRFGLQVQAQSLIGHQSGQTFRTSGPGTAQPHRTPVRADVSDTSPGNCETLWTPVRADVSDISPGNCETSSDTGPGKRFGQQVAGTHTSSDTGPGKNGSFGMGETTKKLQTLTRMTRIISIIFIQICNRANEIGRGLLFTQSFSRFSSSKADDREDTVASESARGFWRAEE